MVTVQAPQGGLARSDLLTPTATKPPTVAALAGEGSPTADSSNHMPPSPFGMVRIATSPRYQRAPQIVIRPPLQAGVTIQPMQLAQKTTARFHSETPSAGRSWR